MSFLFHIQPNSLTQIYYFLMNCLFVTISYAKTLNIGQ